MLGALIAIGLILWGAYYLLESSAMQLDPSSILSYAQTAGFPGQDAQTAVAVALAESSGNPYAIGDLTLGVSIGLWQINLKAHPEYLAVNLMDPQTNANAAYTIYRNAGGSFSPWTTFTSGAYRQYLTTSSAGNSGGGGGY